MRSIWRRTVAKSARFSYLRLSRVVFFRSSSATFAFSAPKRVLRRAAHVGYPRWVYSFPTCAAAPTRRRIVSTTIAVAIRPVFLLVDQRTAGQIGDRAGHRAG